MHVKEGTAEWALLGFFKERVPKKPVIAAISGGSDSMALYGGLQWVKKIFPVKVVVAHVHHGVRRESDGEEEYLRELSRKNGDFFYVKRIQPVERDFENWAREMRYGFFYELFQEWGAECCILAHHADDVAETVLKRIFEGAPLERLKGMEKIGRYREMPLWRPFLELPKRKLQATEYFTDETNLNGKNLRARMRRGLIPVLEEGFGKKIQKPILKLAREAAELSDYVESLFPEMGEEFERREWHPFLLKQFLRKWLNRNGLSATDDQLEKLRRAILSNKSGQIFRIGDKKIRVGREKVALGLVGV